jgi:hypothetical protein
MTTYGIVNTALLNLRAGASTDQAVLRVLAKDTVVEVLGNTNGEWVQVRLFTETLTGFASRAFLRLTDVRPDNLPPTNSQPLTGQGEVITNALNIRAAASLSATILQTVSQGTLLNLLAREGDWIRIRLPSGVGEGFVAAQFINLNPAPRAPRYLIENTELMKAPLAPNKRIPAQPASTQKAVIERVWNNYGGLLATLSDMLSIPVNTVVAVIAAESGGNAFGLNNRMIIRFENHIFYRYWGSQNQALFNQHFTFDANKTWQGHTWRPRPEEPFQNFHGNQEQEWLVFSFARRPAISMPF